MPTFGIGEQVDETDKGTPKYEYGKVTVTGKAVNTAIERYPGESVAGAVGRLLVEQYGHDSGE